MQQLTPTQKARAKYEINYLKITVRLDPSFDAKIRFLTTQHGNQNSAIAYAINHAYVGDRIHKDRANQLEAEKAELSDEIERLKAELNAAKRHSYSQEEQDELLEIVLREWESRQNRGIISPALDDQFLAFETAQDEII